MDRISTSLDLCQTIIKKKERNECRLETVYYNVYHIRLSSGQLSRYTITVVLICVTRARMDLRFQPLNIITYFNICIPTTQTAETKSQLYQDDIISMT